MFDIGFFELLLVLALGLVVVGPRRLPGLVRHLVARWRRLRGWVSDFQNDMERQLDVRGLEQDLHNNRVMRRLDEAQRTGAEVERELRGAAGVSGAADAASTPGVSDSGGGDDSRGRE